MDRVCERRDDFLVWKELEREKTGFCMLLRERERDLCRVEGLCVDEKKEKVWAFPIAFKKMVWALGFFFCINLDLP